MFNIFLINEIQKFLLKTIYNLYLRHFRKSYLYHIQHKSGKFGHPHAIKEKLLSYQVLMYRYEERSSFQSFSDWQHAYKNSAVS